MLDLELHCHTCHSPDSLVQLPALIERARAVGLARLAITDHRVFDGARRAFEMAPDLIIPGVEAMTTSGELLCYFLREALPDALSLAETIERVHAQGGICGPSHPFDPRRYGIGGDNIRRYADRLDFVEVFNARTRDPRRNEEARQIALEFDLPMICASDAHTLPEVGISRVRLKRDYTSPRDFLAAVREGELLPVASDLRANVGSRVAAIAHAVGLGKPNESRGGSQTT
ncbi:MAG: PHP domain-containing protein [Thermoflexales bacterium]|nr:PHP domain-containing protein [Thermoflexales bacterium]